MFEQTLLDSHKSIATHRGRSAVISFVLQGLVILIVVLIPLMFTQALPVKELTTTLVAPPPPPPPPPPPGASAAVKPQPVAKINPTAELRTPTRIPQKIEMVKEQQQGAPAPPTMGGVLGGVPGGVKGGTVGGVIGGVLSSVPTNLPAQPKPQRVRVSQGVTKGLLQHQVKPQYPPLAKQARIQGPVELKALIGKDGKIENLQVVSGHPMLTQAALRAVKQWRYKPYYLNGQPVEVETDITVNFSLASG